MESRPSLQITQLVISTFLLSTVAPMVLQNNDCELVNADGSRKYYACMAEPLHLLRNAAFRLEIDPPDATCGNPRNTYCTLGLRECFSCDAAIPSEAHPLELIYDNQQSSDMPNLDTWWQSISWTDYPTPLNINITMSFNKSYEFQDDLTITFKSSRPQRMILEKSVDYGATWEPLQYYDLNCRRFYDIGASRFTTPQEPDRVLCSQEYSLGVPYTNGEVKFSVVQDRFVLFLGDALTDYRALYRAYNNTNLRQFLTFTDLRIQLLYPSTDGKESLRKPEDLIRYYYAIADMEVIGGCSCNLHAKICKMEGGRTVCDCRHNTEGDSCERCQPLYNARPWKPGFYEPYPDGTANECKKCQCYDHATSCQYDVTRGIGICMGCVHNTTGIQCELCLTGYFRNYSLPLSSPNVCADCDCERLGVLNDDMTCSPPDGQCQCKPRVAGRRCDTCVDQYYGLLLPDTITPGECKPCQCNIDGTQAQNNVCEKEAGQCPCKSSVAGRNCSVCRDGFYDFPRARPWAECTSCSCDRGGSTSHVCDKTRGQCTCRPGVKGRRCNEAATGFYAPALDDIQLQPRSGTCALATDLSTTQRPFTGRMFARCFETQTINFDDVPAITQQADIDWPYVPVLRYSLNTTSRPWPSASLEVTVTGNSGIDLTWYRQNVNQSLDANCGHVTGFIETATYTNLTAGYGVASLPDRPIGLDPRCRYSVSLTVGPAGGATSVLLVDSVIMSPDVTASRVYMDSDNTTRARYNDCFRRLMAVSQRRETLENLLCRGMTFAVGTELAVGALTCGCSLIGTQPGTVCDPLGGQCNCRSGVIGRRCDLCAPGYFNFTTTGCQACSCTQLGSTNLACDLATGQCPCRPFVAVVGQNNTRGQQADRRCSSCLANYHGFNSGAGCQLCMCTVAGSISTQCDDLGVCPCKPTIGGASCDRCQDGFYGFSANGCLPCNCSREGSTSGVCDVITGQCQCKVNVQGSKCDLCADGSFNLGITPDGCQKCFCHGHGTTCISAPDYSQRLIYSESTMSVDWLDASPLGVRDSSWLARQGVTIFDLQYVQAPPEFLGNQLYSYGQYLRLDIRVLGGDDILLTGYRPIIMEGNGKTIYYDIGNLTLSMDFQQVELMLTEHYWSYNATTRPDYFNMYAILADLQAIYLQRTLGLQTIMIVNVTLVSAQPARTGEPQVTYVELCDCDTNRNTQGESCQECAVGSQRQTVNGSVYETCKPCDCSGRGETFPPLCHPGTGQCLNCRNGTIGFNCQTCAENVVGAQCDTCTATFWGLGRDGCQGCDCDPIGSTGTTCAQVDGQCVCKPNVVSRKCDECADNYFNLQTAGCQECDACYGLVYQEVNILRAMRDNLTVFVTEMQQQDNNTILGPFSQRLDRTLRQMATLRQFLNDARSVAGSVTPQLARLDASLRHLEEIVDIDITSSTFMINNTVNHVENLVVRAQRANEDTQNTVIQTYELLVGPIAAMTTRMRAVLSELQDVETALSQVSTGAMADANRILAVVRQIESDAELAKTTADDGLQAAQNAETVHRDTTQRIGELKRYIALVSSLGERVTSAAQSTLGNASLALREVMVALENSTAMETVPIDGGAIQRRAADIKAAAESLELQATIAENTLEAGNMTIIYKVAVAKVETARLTSRVTDLETQSGAVITRFQSAYQMALHALGNESQTFQDASNMLNIMRDFNSRAQAVERQANSSLALVQQVRSLSESSITTARQMQARLRVTFNSAQEAQQTANNSYQIATRQEQSYRPVYQGALQLQEYANPILTDVGQVASSVTQATQEDVRPARITCEGLESQVRSVANRTLIGEVRTRDATSRSSATKLRVDAILSDLRNIHRLDMATLVDLRRRVRETRRVFDERRLAEAVAALKEASAQQREALVALQRRRDAAAVAVRRMADVRRQLLP